MSKARSNENYPGPRNSTGSIGGRLSQVGLTRDGWRIAGILLWRAVLLGTGLYLILTSEQDTNLRLNLVAYIVAVVWSYYDGLFAKGWWRLAWLEAIFLHLAGVQVGNFLALLFGNPVHSS